VTPHYPHVKVDLSNVDGNALSLMGIVTRAMKKEKLSKASIDEFMREAMQGDYDHLLQTIMKTVTVEV
jgi:hypothetical protein